ncbi:uncharacterized protein LOC127790224 [Diospyros lotus]|uniref:uncharacterized protein LOC127790224 n=1 Tax=Diospyros lotus TaxID=55363 RepID=UPI00225A576F|nr:uncharacterized protein LOC127790224 [Diospyros lotus]
MVDSCKARTRQKPTVPLSPVCQKRRQAGDTCKTRPRGVCDTAFDIPKGTRPGGNIAKTNKYLLFDWSEFDLLPPHDCWTSCLVGTGSLKRERERQARASLPSSRRRNGVVWTVKLSSPADWGKTSMTASGDCRTGCISQLLLVLCLSR